MSANLQSHIPVMEHFYTLQGEGFYAGTAAYFIRLAGCDVGCHWCDVKESWTVDEKQWMNISDLVDEIKKTATQRVVITGGEPLMYDLLPLTTALKNENYFIHIETSGAYPLSGILDWICVSPKKFKPVLKEVLLAANELKCIIFHKSDFDFAEQNRVLTNEKCQLYLQAEWSKRELFYPEIVAYCKQYPYWKLSVQTHKYLDIP